MGTPVRRVMVPLSQKVGEEITYPTGVVSYVNGLATPLQLLKQGVLAWMDLHHTFTLGYSQPAGAAAWTFNSLGPWGIISSAVVNVGNRGGFDQSLSGYAMMVREAFTHPAFQPAYTAPLPPANSGTQTATGNLSWDYRQRLFLSMSEADLRGLIFMQSQSAATYLKLRYNQVASLIASMSTGSVTSFTGQTTVTGYGFGLGSLTAADLAVAHVQEEVPYAVPQGVTKVQIPLQVGEIVQRIFLQAYVGNLPDTTGQIPLETVELQIGTSRPQSWSGNELLFSNQLRDRSNLPGGVWVLNWAPGGGTQYKDWRTTPQAFLNLYFSGTGAPANSQFMILYEYQREYGAVTTGG